MFTAILVLVLVLGFTGCDSTVDPPADVAVSAITVAGTDDLTIIDTDEGTLQMLAAALPADATDTSVTWSVEAGTGTATISSAGILTAVTDGTVTVKATSVSTPAVSGELEITISNQKTVIVEDETGLKAALANTEINKIIFGNDIVVENMLEIRREITIDGKENTLKSTFGETDRFALKIDSLGSNTVVRNLTIEASGYTGDVIYVSTGKNVTIENCILTSTDYEAIGIYFDKTSSGSAINNTITARKAIGADTLEIVTITGNTLTFSNLGIELISADPKVVINSEAEETLAEIPGLYEVSGNTYNEVL